MADKNLPPGWLAFETDDHEWYYYNEATKETTWDKPKPVVKLPAKPATMPPKPSPAPQQSATPAGRPNPFGGGAGGRGGLLAGIQGGAKLKKTPKPVEKGPSNTGGGAKGGAAPSSGGGGMMGEMQAKLANRGGAGGGGGGFKEIMRKNKEAAAKKAASSGTGGSSVSPKVASAGRSSKWPKPGETPKQTVSSSPSTSSVPSGRNGGSVEERLASIESKLDKIMNHLKI